MSGDSNEPILGGRRILVLGVNYTPELTGIGPYTAKLSEQLARAGASVHVVTSVPHYPEWRIHEPYRGVWLRRESENQVNITRLRTYVPRRQTAVQRALFELSFAAGSALMGLVDQRPAAVVAITPNLGSIAVARLVASAKRAAFGVIVQDLMGAAASQSGLVAPSAASAAARLEARLLQSADGIGVITDGFRRALRNAGVPDHKITLLPNPVRIRPDRRNQVQARKELGWPEGFFYVVHTGNVGHKQHLENVVQAGQLAGEQGLPLMFVIVGEGNRSDAIRREARTVSRVQVYPPVSDELYPTVLAAADALLVNERSSVLDMSLPSKLTSYFSAGRPVLAAVRDDGTTADEIKRAGAGVLVPPNDPQKLVAAAVRLSDDGQLRESLGSAGMAYARLELTEEAADARYERFVSSLLDAGESTSP